MLLTKISSLGFFIITAGAFILNFIVTLTFQILRQVNHDLTRYDKLVATTSRALMIYLVLSFFIWILILVIELGKKVARRGGFAKKSFFVCYTLSIAVLLTMIFTAPFIYPHFLITCVLNLVFLSAVVYCCYYAGNLLRTVLLNSGSKVATSTLENTFLLLFFIPVGVWILQPKIRDVFANRNG